MCFALFGLTRAEAPSDFIEELKLYSRALGAILEGYVHPMNARDLLYQAVKGMLVSLDLYSEFIDRDHYQLLQIDMKGEYSGIGAALELVDNVISIKERSLSTGTFPDLENRMKKYQPPAWLTLDPAKKIGSIKRMPEANEVGLLADPTKIKEFYSR